MKWRRLSFMLTLLAVQYLAFTVSNAAVGVVPRAHPPGFDSLGVSYDEIVVCFDAPPIESALQAFLAANSLRLVDRGSSGKVFLFKLDDSLKLGAVTSTTWADSLRSKYRGDPAIRSISPQQIVGTVGATPSDPRYAYQWHIPQTKLNYGWDITSGLSSIVLGIHDSGGELTHSDLANALWNGQNDPDVWSYGHGTRVGGITAAVTNNGIGIAGTAGGWSAAGGVRLMFLGVTDANGNVLTQPAADGLVFAADNNAHIVNLSWGGPNISSIISDAITYALDRNCVLMSISHNDDPGHVYWPGRRPEIICVGASNIYDYRASFSNYGGPDRDSLDLVAPGVGIWSTIPSNGYGSANGTSYAAPQVSGVAALIMSVNQGIRDASAPSRRNLVTEILCTTTDKVGYTYNEQKPYGTWHEEMGYGRINAYKAVLAAMPSGSHTITTSLTFWNDFTINSGVTLTLASGATLTFEDGWFTIDGTLIVEEGATIIMPVDEDIIVNGTLTINGTQGNEAELRFAPSSRVMVNGTLNATYATFMLDPGTGYLWHAIRKSNNTGTIQLTNCTVKDATPAGVYVTSTSVGPLVQISGAPPLPCL